MKLTTFSEAAQAVEDEEWRGLEYMHRGRPVVRAWRVGGRYWVDEGEGATPLALTVEQATKPCWRPTNDV